MSSGGFAVVACILITWLGVNVADAVWQYFYIMACVHPNPRTPVNITHSGWEGYETMMFLFGFPWGLVNMAVFWGYFSQVKWSSLLSLFHIFVMGPISIIMILAPFFGPWVALPIAQNVAWNTGCSNYPISVVLHAVSYYGPKYADNTAQYFSNGSPLYTYDIFNPAPDIWSYSIRTIDSPALQQNKADALYPSISNVSYDFVGNTFSANCTSPSSNTSTTCFEGTFNPNYYLSFEITDLRSNVTTNLRAVDKQWSFSDDAPSVLLKDGTGAQVIRTDVTKKDDCTQLKVCSAQQNSAEMIVPMGILLITQAEYAIECTTPSDDNN